MLSKPPRVSRAAEKATPEAPASPTADIPTGTEYLLMVDDDETVLTPVAKLLRGLGYRVEVAESGGEALRILGRSLEDVDLLITDLQMPGMTGEELALAVTESKPGTKVLFVSGDVAVGPLNESGNEQTRYLSKPFLPSELARCVRRMLDAS